MLQKVAASSDAGHAAIASEMRTYDDMPAHERRGLDEADHNLFPSEARTNGIAWALTLDMRGTVAFRQKRDSFGFNSTPAQAERIRQDILAASKVRRGSNRVQIRRRQIEERRFRLAAIRAKPG